MRALLTVNALILGLFVFARLDRSVAERLGPVGEAVYDRLAPPTRASKPISATGDRFIKDAEALSGRPIVSVTPGILGRSESFYVQFRGGGLDDDGLGRLAALHGDRIEGLSLVGTRVTEAGLRHLKKLTALRHLEIRNNLGQPRPSAMPPITDAGMVHLRGLARLRSLDLGGLPITDAGLEAIKDLPGLDRLRLVGTRVKGPGLARMRSLPGLSSLSLDNSATTDEGLMALRGAASLRSLSVNRVPLTRKVLSVFGALPRLDHLEVAGCGLLDDEVNALVKGKPGLKVKLR